MYHVRLYIYVRRASVGRAMSSIPLAFRSQHYQALYCTVLYCTAVLLILIEANSCSKEVKEKRQVYCTYRPRPLELFWMCRRRTAGSLSSVRMMFVGASRV